MDVALPNTLNKTWRENKSNFGYKMLMKMGWKEEKGLGKDESGIVDNIKLKKREVGLGLGVEKSTDGAGLNGWTQTSQSFTDVLEVLKLSYGTSDKKKKKSKKAKTPTVSVGMK
jgi:Pin2-interacting protein X1